MHVDDDKNEAGRDEIRVTNGSYRPPVGVDGSRPRRWHARRSECQHLWYAKHRAVRFHARFGQLPVQADRPLICPLQALAIANVRERRSRGSRST